MSTQIETPSISTLEYLPYLTEEGSINEAFQGKIGVYAIFDRGKEMQYVGYSRDIYLSLKQHLIRQSQKCYWLKVQTISRPSRTILDEIAAAWINENGVEPPGNSESKLLWTEPIDANPTMTEEEKAQYHKSEESKQIKIRKNVARRVEAKILEQLGDRGVKMDIRFNPKLKEKGLLDLK
jgi:hypothetical protein